MTILERIDRLVDHWFVERHLLGGRRSSVVRASWLQQRYGLVVRRDRDTSLEEIR
jgi:hypothetical protein